MIDESWITLVFFQINSMFISTWKSLNRSNIFVNAWINAVQSSDLQISKHPSMESNSWVVIFTVTKLFSEFLVSTFMSAFLLLNISIITFPIKKLQILFFYSRNDNSLIIFCKCIKMYSLLSIWIIKNNGNLSVWAKNYFFHICLL